MNHLSLPVVRARTQLLRVLPAVTFFFLNLPLSPGCRQETPVGSSSTNEFTGITSTSADGMILSTDPDDWKPVTEAGLTVQPSYPNPCNRVTSFTVSFTLARSDSIVVTLNDRPGHVAFPLVNETLSPGTVRIRPAITYLEPRIYRVYFRIIRQEGEYVTYGDVDIR